MFVGIYVTTAPSWKQVSQTFHLAVAILFYYAQEKIINLVFLLKKSSGLRNTLLLGNIEPMLNSNWFRCPIAEVGHPNRITSQILPVYLYY